MYNKNHKKKYHLTSEDFYKEVEKRLSQIKITEHKLTLITLDFDNFNYVNDLFGYRVGDLTLEKIIEHFNTCLKDNDIFCKVHADHFVFCLDTDNPTKASQLFLQLTDLKKALENILPPHYNLVSSAGILVVEDDVTILSALLDKANYARKKSKGNATNTFNIYNDKMRKEVDWKKQITFMMDIALKNREFEMYLQPKLLIKTGEVVGAEALVRWNSSELGMIYPDKFISIMEQNGFIRQLDFFMLEEACRFLKCSKENGIPQLPISVNFSKAHLQTEDLVEKIFQTVNHMGISTRMIEIEFTENLFSDNIDKLIEIVSALKMLGFKVSLDDFGSAYSSLNYLKDIPIDIIKIDKGFLNSSTNTDRGKIIITKVVELIKSLHVLSVMEGVENDEQVKFLQKLNCDLGQGYFYAKPMPIDNYINYINKNSIVEDIQRHLNFTVKEEGDKSYLHNIIPQEFQMDNWELYTLGKNIDMGLMKGYLDGEATVQYVNDRALEYLGYTRQEFREIFNNSIVAFTHPDDVHIVQKNAEQLVTSGKPLKFQTRAIRKDGKIIILQGRSSCIIDGQGRPVGLYAFQDVTEELEKTNKLKHSLENKIKELEEAIASEQKTKEALLISEEKYNIIMEQNDDIMFEWDFESDTNMFSKRYDTLFGYSPFTTNVTTNKEIRDKIHPDDLEVFEEWIVNTYKKPGYSVSSYRIQDINGNYLWMHCRSTAICDSKGRAIRAVGVFSNINAQKQQMDDLIVKSQLDPLTKLLNKTEFQYRIDESLKISRYKLGAFFIIDIDNFKGLNDTLGHQLGDSILIDIANKVSKVFPETDMIGRIGGDEIAVYLPYIDSSIIKYKAEALSQSLRLSYYGSTSKYEISGSIGISLYPEHGDTFNMLYRFADIALYNSKNNGKDRYTIYNHNITNPLLDNSSQVEYTTNFLNTYFQNDITFHVFEMLYESRHVSESIKSILSLLGEKYNMDRVYIFEIDEKKHVTSNTYEWCAPGISSEIDFLQEIPLESLDSYFNQYSTEGLFCCKDIENAADEIKNICIPQGIKSLLHCAIYNEGIMTGFIGFDVCREYYSWTGEEIAILGYISRILSVFLIKNTTTTKLNTSYKNYQEMVENLNGYVYVIDPYTYEVFYINRAIQELGLLTGKPCYKIAFGSDEPCENCPINKFSDDIHYATEEIYSEVLDSWVNSSASRMKWEGDKDAVLVCCTDISKYKFKSRA
ncbi:EAL domain-containing protein [Clostridioides difficile]